MSEETVKINGKLLKELKVNELKSACRERNLPTSGNKSTLVKRLKAQIELEKLQQAARSSPAGGTLPNSDIADVSGENDFIKQYMEAQRKLLQSSRFSSTSEADSEDDSSSHKSGTVVSPLVTRRSRRTTKESNDSSEPEMPNRSDDQIPEVQATVKSTLEEETKPKVVEGVEKKKAENDVKNEPDESQGVSDSLPAIKEESPEKPQEAVQDDKAVNGKQSKDHEQKDVEAKEEQEREQPIVKEEDNQSGSHKKNDTVTVTAVEDSQQPESQMKEKVEPPEIEKTQVKPEAAEESLKGENKLTGQESDTSDEKNDEKKDKEPEGSVQVQQEEKTVNRETTNSAPHEQESTVMEVDDVPPKEETEEIKESQKNESITEETVVDVDEIVNQEEELDYDEIDAPAQDKSESASEKREEESQVPTRGRRLRLKKDKKERRRSKSDSRKADEEKMEDVEEADTVKEPTSRKRRKSSTNDGPKAKDEKDTTPEPVERKVRKRLKRQSLDSKSKVEQVQPPEKVDHDISDAVEITNAPDEKIDELEEKPQQEEKIEPEPEPLIPLRRISINKRETSETGKPRKRKWGGRSTSTENVNISSDLIKDLIDVKPDDIRKAMDDQEEPGELVEEEEEEEVDEIIDITMDEPEQEIEQVDDKTEKHTKQAKEGEEDGEIVEEEEVVVEELEDGESPSDISITQHDNRKVVSGKAQHSSETRTDTKTRKVVSRSDQKRSSKEGSDTGQEKKKESSRKKSSRTSVTVTNKSGPKEPTPPPEPRDVSPSRYEPCKIVHVRNLVRPFTVNQLQGLLGKLGKVSEGSFWIDKIKSHCLIMYETVEDAINARKCLHGINWPSSNPKQLSVDFCAQERADDIKGIVTEKAIPPLMGDWKGDQKSKSEADEKTKKDESRARRSVPEDGKERWEEKHHERDRHGKDDASRRKESQGSPRRADRRGDQSRDRDRRKSADRSRRDDERRGQRRDERTQPLREWDRDKVDQDVEHRRLMRERERERRSPQREERREQRERKQKEEQKQDEQPAKLLDDLFRKTKATPCIYWLPLTDEQVAQRVKERQERREARNKIRREMEEEEQRNRAKMAAERKERNARSPDRRRLSDRARRDSTGDRRPERRPPPRTQVQRSREKGSPVRRKSPQSAGKKPEADSSSDSSSSDSSSGSGSDSDSDSDSSSDDSSPKKK